MGCGWGESDARNAGPGKPDVIFEVGGFLEVEASSALGTGCGLLFEAGVGVEDFVEFAGGQAESLQGAAVVGTGASNVRFQDQIGEAGAGEVREFDRLDGCVVYGLQEVSLAALSGFTVSAEAGEEIGLGLTGQRNTLRRTSQTADWTVVAMSSAAQRSASLIGGR